MYEMIEELSQQFLNNHDEINGLNLLRYIRSSNLFNVGKVIGKFMITKFPHSFEINQEYAIICYYNNDHFEAFDTLQNILDFKGLNKDTAWKTLFNQHFSINHVADRYIYYNPDKIKSIQNRSKSNFPMITLTMTTCKRFDLFEKTINSLLNCLDIDEIDDWFLVDDNSSEEDRTKMKELYPFFNFYFKTFDEKGHPQSMNIIRNYVKTPYMFHLEDDWKFFVKRNYIDDALDVLSSDHKIGQCLFNKNYAEIESDIDIKGGFYKQTNKGIRYFTHEFVRTKDEIEAWNAKYGNCKSSSYWPHFSFRPSLIRTSIIKELGEFNEQVSHFEMEYAYKYFSKGYISAFFEGIYCLHIGRLTSEKDDETKLNAYKLNNEAQFSGKEEIIKQKNKNVKTFIINLDRRPDRWEKFKENAKEIEFLNYERFSAVDGKKLKSTSQLQRIFDNNDYNMRRGMVGCAMSHIKLYVDLINSDNHAYVILEDDIEFVPDFKTKYELIMSSKEPWDMIYLGHHLRNPDRDKDVLSKEKMPEIEKWDVYKSFTNSLGGTTGYIITKSGARKLLDFLNETGMTNGIDTVQQKSANTLDVYYCNPHMIYSECFRGDNNNLDTDIQYDYDSLTVSVEDRLKEELMYYNKNIILIEDFENAIGLSSDVELKSNIYFKSNDESQIIQISKACVHSWYIIDNKVIFVVPLENNSRYFHRFKKNKEFNVEDALIY